MSPRGPKSSLSRVPFRQTIENGKRVHTIKLESSEVEGAASEHLNFTWQVFLEEMDAGMEPEHKMAATPGQHGPAAATHLEMKVGEGNGKPQAPFYPTTGQPPKGEGFFCAPPSKA